MTRSGGYRSTTAVGAVLSTVLALVLASPGLASQSGPGTLTSVSASVSVAKITDLADLSPELIDPTGITYIPSEASLIIVDSEVDEEPTVFQGSNMLTLGITSGATSGGLVADSDGNLEPTGAAFDSRSRTLFVSSDANDEVLAIRPGGDGRYGTADDLMTVPDYSGLALSDLEDVAFDVARGHLLLLDGLTQNVHRVAPGANGEFDGVFPQGDDVVTSLDLPSAGIFDAKGLDFLEVTDSLFVTDRRKNAVLELSMNGNLVRTIDLSSLKRPGVSLEPSDVVLAPASDGSGVQRLYVVDRGDDNGDPTDGEPPARDGRLVELVVDLSGGRFTDDNDSIFQEDIEWLASQGITSGCNPPANDRFCPGDPVTRGQMAAFLVRALDLVEGVGDDVFVDDDTSIFEADIDRLARIGVLRGCDPPANSRACPGDFVTRGQMAAFLVRSLGYTERAGDLFVDDDGSIFEGDIDRLATVRVTRGCNPPVNDRFCPDDLVSRGQMAAFLRRALSS